jgi:hypothetical protein
MLKDTKIVRIDSQIFDKSINEQSKLNTLKDLQVVHNAAFLIELKDKEEIVNDIKENTQIKKPIDTILVDDTEDIRTIIVNQEIDKSDVKRFLFNLDWSLKELV